MWPVSQRFLDSLGSTHEAIARARILPRVFGTDDIGFGTDCPNGVPLTILDGDVKMTRTGDVKATLDMTVACEDAVTWRLLRPLGSDIFVERGIDFGDGTQEWVPLGWYRIETIDQDDAPYGPIKISAQDRLSQIAQNKALYPVRLPEGSTDRDIFSRFVNGDLGSGPSTAGSAAYFFLTLPITFTGYDPDAVSLAAPVYVQDDQYKYLVEKADGQNCVLRMAVTGELLVEQFDAVAGVDAGACAISPGEDGNLVHASRNSTRKDTYNIVSSYSNSGSVSTGYQWASDDTSIVGQRGPFGPKIMYFTSPVLMTPDDATGASAWWISQYGGIPVDYELDIVPNPALRPNDVVPVDIGDGAGFADRRIESITIPLVGDGASAITARVLETS